ncbi:MAG TPA: M28 family peptidase [Candidatus Binatia bacterium]|nr:M28 family peptidase [Candidatus Binatia bacterium]
MITAPVLAAPIRFLADDLLEGRGPGTRADALTRLYVATTMQMLGLEPGAADGSWEQSFELVGVTSHAPARWRFAGARGDVELRDERDFVAVSGAARPSVELAPSELVFVGYGIEAPEFDWDDFKGTDVRGKVLVFLNDDPDWDPALFAGKRRLYYGRWTYKYENAARHDAAAAIVIHTDPSAGYPWQTVVRSWTGENSRLAEDDEPSVAVQAWVTEDAAKRIATLGGRSLDDLVSAARRRDFRPVPLGVTTALRLHSDLRTYRSANVAGLLRGADPTRRDELVVLTAHHDHLGVKSNASGALEVYNGAMDNASGVAQLLALARAFTSRPSPPARSILFLAVAAEEQGLLGSKHYARHPTVPPGKLAANLNFDGANLWGRTTDVRAVGWGKSSLDDAAARAAARQGRTYEDEEFPEKGSFYRSDQFSFAKIGVPAIEVRGGVEYVGRPAGWGREQVEGWIARHYHQPSDDYDPSWDLSGMVEDTRLAFEVARAVADAPDMPRWRPGDEFEATRLRALADAAASR